VTKWEIQSSRCQELRKVLLQQANIESEIKFPRVAQRSSQSVCAGATLAPNPAAVYDDLRSTQPNQGGTRPLHLGLGLLKANSRAVGKAAMHVYLLT
jgi:hypothetical protein